MTTVKEKFTSDGLFVAMDSVKNFDWRENFSPSQMDSLFIAMFGDHVLADSFAEKEVSEIASDLAGFFIDRWNSIFGFMFDKNLFTLGFSETITENISDDGTNTNNETRDKTNKVSAYNDENFVNDSSENETTGNTGTNKNERVRTYQRQGFNSTLATTRLKYLTTLQNDFIYDIIFKEVKTIITAPIFDSEL